MSAHQSPPRRKTLETLRRILRRPRGTSRNKILPAAQSPKNDEETKLNGTGDISGAVDVMFGDGGAAVAPAPAPVTPTATAAPSMAVTPTAPAAAAPSAPLRVGYLCAEPLVWRSSSEGSLRALPPVQRHRGAELALLKRILGSAPAHVRLRAEPCATVAALRSLLTGGCDVVHYTGHGVRGALTFELEGRAELDVCTEETLGRLVAAGGHRTKVVFLAACDSERPAKALTRQGIPHVVCVRAGARLSDRTARAFSEQFYDALCRGKTVRSAFDVAAAVDEHGSYLLLPSGGAHDTVLCDSTEESHTTIETPRPCPVRGPAPPERLAGRHDAVAEVVRLIGFERRRCVTVRGARGVGKTAVARAAVSYLADRGNFDVVCEVTLGDVRCESYEDYFGLSPARRDDAVERQIERRLVTLLADTLETLFGSPPSPTRPAARRVQDHDTESSPEVLVKALAGLSERRCLLVADGVTADNRAAVLRISKRLLAAAPTLSVMTTGVIELSAGDLGERVVDLGPLAPAAMAELLTELAPRRVSSAEMLDGGGDASLYSPATALSFDRPFSPPAPIGGDVRALRAFGKHPAVAALKGNCAAAVKFAPELKRPLRHHQALVAAARAAVVEADDATVASSWDWASPPDWACRAMSA
jgi:hypothetical protein